MVDTLDLRAKTARMTPACGVGDCQLVPIYTLRVRKAKVGGGAYSDSISNAKASTTSSTLDLFQVANNGKTASQVYLERWQSG